MKKDIHPEYRKVVFLDTSSDFKFCLDLLLILTKQSNGKTAIRTH